MPAGKAALKEIIDEHFHRPGWSPSAMELDVEDRAAAGGMRTVGGREVQGASGGFIDLVGGGRIPFHRVREVRSSGKAVYRRAGRR